MGVKAIQSDCYKTQVTNYIIFEHISLQSQNLFSLNHSSQMSGLRLEWPNGMRLRTHSAWKIKFIKSRFSSVTIHNPLWRENANKPNVSKMYAQITVEFALCFKLWITVFLIGSQCCFWWFLFSIFRFLCFFEHRKMDQDIRNWFRFWLK